MFTFLISDETCHKDKYWVLSTHPSCVSTLLTVELACLSLLSGCLLLDRALSESNWCLLLKLRHSLRTNGVFHVWHGLSWTYGHDCVTSDPVKRLNNTIYSTCWSQGKSSFVGKCSKTSHEHSNIWRLFFLLGKTWQDILKMLMHYEERICTSLWAHFELDSFPSKSCCINDFLALINTVSPTISKILLITVSS